MLPTHQACGRRVATYCYRLRDDHLVREFVVANAADPHQTVETQDRDGAWHAWPKRTRGTLTIFCPPDAYQGGQPLLWRYDDRVQIGRPMERAELERYAMDQRVSIHL